MNQSILKRLDKVETQLGKSGWRAYEHCHDPRDWPMDALVDYELWRYEQDPQYQGRPELAEARAALSAGDEWEAAELLHQLHRPSREEMARMLAELAADPLVGPFSPVKRVRAALDDGDDRGAWRELWTLLPRKKSS